MRENSLRAHIPEHVGQELAVRSCSPAAQVQTFSSAISSNCASTHWCCSSFSKALSTLDTLIIRVMLDSAAATWLACMPYAICGMHGCQQHVLHLHAAHLAVLTAPLHLMLMQALRAQCLLFPRFKNLNSFSSMSAACSLPWRSWYLPNRMYAAFACSPYRARASTTASGKVPAGQVLQQHSSQLCMFEVACTVTPQHMQSTSAALLYYSTVD